MSAQRRSFKHTLMDLKIIAKHRAVTSLAVPSRSASEYMGNTRYDDEDSNVIEARQINRLNQRFEEI